MDILALIIIVCVGLWLFGHLTIPGFLLFGGSILILHIHLWRNGDFHKYELGSIVPILLIVVLWLVWLAGFGMLLYENSTPISQWTDPITKLFFR